MPYGTNATSDEIEAVRDQYADDNVTQFPPKPAQPDLLVGPFTEWRVMVEGRLIPRLTGFHDGDKIALVVDHRFSASFSPEDARQAAWLIAQAMAIGEGYSWLGAESKDKPFASFGKSLTRVPCTGSAGLAR